MFNRLEEVALRYRKLELELSKPEVTSNPSQLRELTRELAGLRETVQVYEKWRGLNVAIEENRALLRDPDPEIRELAKAEIATSETLLASMEESLKCLLIPRDPNDDRNIVLEIRAGVGGVEAALFAADLLRMYTRYAERQGWKSEVLSSSRTDANGVREVVVAISGDRVYRQLKYERGVHRVQRVPVTESQGRIHTSTVTVAVLPEAKEVEVRIADEDLRIDVYRSSGPGGQSVNTTDSAVRITHEPSGIVVTCQDEKSQHKNKARAFKILRSRLFELQRQRQEDARAQDRRGQIGSGDRSERIRTYNFPQSRVSDHRTNLSVHDLEKVLDGDLDVLVDSAAVYFETQQLQAGNAE
ncbi:MAG: peptide chain release factor 1 [Myxococcales bacterium]|nr:peptide chain release factor 1 [Myxococcales bacterium]